jgi:hypothetical protein
MRKILEVRISKYETIRRLSNFINLLVGFVSNFDIRISDFQTTELVMVPAPINLQTSGGGHRNWVPRSRDGDFFHRPGEGP